jgi:long-subunit fatty acid transport protein
MSRHLLVSGLLALAGTAAAASVDATAVDFGFQPVALGAGARALGMGGAFSAVADDATAVTWNPAGLTQCEVPEVAASLGWYRSRTESAEAGTTSGEALRLDHVSGLLPFFALGCQQVVGLAWQRPYDFSRSIAWQTSFVDADFGFETHSQETRDSSGSFASLGLSYAIEVHPGLSCGLTVNRWDDAWTRASHYRTTSGSQTVSTMFGMENTTLIDATADTRVLSGTSAVLGAFWQASPALTLALVVKPAYNLRLEQNAQVHYVTDNGSGPVDAPYATSTTADLRHPPSLILGSAWRQGDVHTLSCDATVTRWSQYGIDDGTKARSPVNFHLDSADFPDLWTLRLGYEYVAILPRVILVPRCGLLLEDLPAATKAPSLSQAEQVSATRDRWWGASAGLGICQRSVFWDLGVQVRYGNDVGAGQFAPPNQTVDMLVTTARLGLTVPF